MVPNPDDFSSVSSKALLSRTRAVAIILLRVSDCVAVGYWGQLTTSGFLSCYDALRRHWLTGTAIQATRYVVLKCGDLDSLLYAKNLPGDGYLLGLVFSFPIDLVNVRQDMERTARALVTRTELAAGHARKVEQSLHTSFAPGSHPDPDARSQSTHQDHGRKGERRGTRESVRVNLNEWVHITEGLQEDTIRKSHTQRSGEGQDSTGLSPKDAPGGDEELGGDMVGASWKALRETFLTDEDLVSIYQGDFELRDRTAGLNDWMAFPELAEIAPILSHQEHSAVKVSLDEVEYPDKSEVYAVSNITFYLVPRQDDDYILGELAHRLRSWLVEICHHYAWQLDFLSVRPNYLKWTLRDFPHLLAQDMLQIVRQVTTQRICRLFSQRQQGTVVDFWASGYLMDLENQEFSTQGLMAHIAHGSSRVMQPTS